MVTLRPYRADDAPVPPARKLQIARTKIRKSWATFFFAEILWPSAPPARSPDPQTVARTFAS